MTTDESAALSALIAILRENGVREYEGHGIRISLGHPVVAARAPATQPKDTADPELFAPTTFAELQSVVPRRS